jgi:nicotinamide-nucleotide amidase
VHIEVINTGTELLLGSTQNTHAAWLGRELFRLGLRIARLVTVPDGDAIKDALNESIKRSDVVIVTGGLGPTSDDITREATAKILDLELIEDEAAMRSLESFFSRINKPMAEVNRKQAYAPVGADVLPNSHGTAPGVYVPPRLSGEANCAIFLLPGPPREMYPMFFAEVEPRLRALAGIDVERKMCELKFTGIGESEFHQGIDQQLSAISGLEYGYCARISEVDLRLIGNEEVIHRARMIVLHEFSDHLISENGDSLEVVVVKLLKENGLTLTLAESCTGGLISSRITDVPGASSVFTHGFITYANLAKTIQLDVPQNLLDQYGAVSEEIACAMAVGALKSSGANIAAAVTGIAGPSGGTLDKPVGTAWVAVAFADHSVTAKKVFHPRDRNGFKRATSQSVLDFIREEIQRSFIHEK